MFKCKKCEDKGVYKEEESDTFGCGGGFGGGGTVHYYSVTKYCQCVKGRELKNKEKEEHKKIIEREKGEALKEKQKILKVNIGKAKNLLAKNGFLVTKKQ